MNLHVIGTDRTNELAALTTLASMNAYSNSALPSSSCWWRKAALLTEWKRATWRTWEAGKCSRWIVCSKAMIGHRRRWATFLR
jgi:hypothetical protein